MADFYVRKTQKQPRTLCLICCLLQLKKYRKKEEMTLKTRKAAVFLLYGQNLLLVLAHFITTTSNQPVHIHNNYAPDRVCLWSLFGRSGLRRPLFNTTYSLPPPTPSLSNQQPLSVDAWTYSINQLYTTNVFLPSDPKLTQWTSQRGKHVNMSICYYGSESIYNTLQLGGYSLHLNVDMTCTATWK